MASRTRRFGVIVQNLDQGNPLTPRPLTQELERCGAEPAYVYEQMGDDDVPAQDAANVMLQMHSRGVTSLFCLCIWGNADDYGSAGAGQGYVPEWLISTYFDMDRNAELRTWFKPPALLHSFGLSFRPKQITIQADPAYQAVTEVDPVYSCGYSCETGLHWHYRELLLLASGIQMAGPNLNPETFERGLQRALFPNPLTTQYAGAVGFRRDYSMTDDAAEYWWSQSARDPVAGTAGAMCYVAHGLRHALDGWASLRSQPDPFFGPECDSGT